MHKDDKGHKRAATTATIERAIDAARKRSNPLTQGVSALAQGSKRLRNLLASSSGGVVEIPTAWVEQIVGLPGVDPHPAAFASLSPEVHAVFSAAWNSPEGQGWLRLFEMLNEAGGDPLIVASKPASTFLALMRELVGDSVTASDGMRPMRDLESVIAAMRANDRHKPARAAELWVAEEWAKYGVKEYKGNKSAFARDYSARCAREHGVSVKERTIREKWLQR